MVAMIAQGNGNLQRYPAKNSIVAQGGVALRIDGNAGWLRPCSGRV
jgi:hypothetical protein